MPIFCANCLRPNDQSERDLCHDCDSRVINVETPDWIVLGYDPPGMVYEPKQVEPWRDETGLAVFEIERDGDYVDASDTETYYYYQGTFYGVLDIESDLPFRKLNTGDWVRSGNHETGDTGWWKVPPSPDLRTCKKCSRIIDLNLAFAEPGKYPDRMGTMESPLPPADWDMICAACGYV